MREIKFRAWDKTNKRMSWQFELGENMLTFDAEPGYCDSYLFEDLNLEEIQYTGLKDKNGVEIFEGDIIFVPSWRRKYKIVFEAGMFRARNVQDGWKENKISLATFKGEINCEVIGNIFENPELLSNYNTSKTQ